MIHVGIYVRKSKQVDNSDSMETQIAMCEAFCEQKYGKGKYISHIYDKDYGITGHSIKLRKDFQRMMQDMRTIPLNLIVIQRYDRIARNTRDFCNIYHEMEQCGCELASVSQQIDTTTPYGKKFMYDQASMAELEWALCSERRKDANRYARSVGKYNAPSTKVVKGYKVGYVGNLRTLVIDREAEPMVRDLFEHYKLYRNYTRTMRYINEKYDERFTVNKVKYIIRSPLFKGEYRENKHFCEPYLTEAEWNDLQKEIPLIRDDDKKREEILFSGLIRCPSCGRKMRAQTKTKPNGHKFRYYHCEYHIQGSCACNKVKSELIIESQLVDGLDTFLSQYKANIKAQAHSTSKPKVNTKKLQSELERLNVMYQKGRITDEYYDSEYIRISNQLSVAVQPEQEKIDIAEIESRFPSDWKETYNALTKLNKKLFWRGVLQQIIVDEKMDVIDIIFL